MHQPWIVLPLAVLLGAQEKPAAKPSANAKHAALEKPTARDTLSAQKFEWQPSPGHTQVPIWPGKTPDPQPVKGPEFAMSSGTSFLVAGKPAVEVDNVTQPTMTVYSPKGKNTGAAVIVFPDQAAFLTSIIRGLEKGNGGAT
jgi:hypothetical protein